MSRHKRKTSPPPAAFSQGQRLRRWLLGGATALFVARPLFPSESAAIHGDGLTMVMLWIAMAVFWLLGAIGRPRRSQGTVPIFAAPAELPDENTRPPRKWDCPPCAAQAGPADEVYRLNFGWTDAAVLALVGWHTVAALAAVVYGSPRPAVNMLWEWVGMGLCFLLMRQFIATVREARALIAVMVALAVAIAGYGLYQYAYEMPQTRAQYEADPDGAMREAGLWFPPDSPERQRFADRLYGTEPMATFALTNSLAGFLAPWLAVLAGLCLGAAQKRKRLLGMVLCLLPIAACLLLTKSRSGYVAAGVGLLLAWLLCRPDTLRGGWKASAAIAAATAVLVAVLVALGGLDRDVLGQASKSLGYRLQYWQSSLRMIGDSPLLGCGPGNFQNVYPQYKLPEASEEVADPHNFLLEIWATAGTPAMLAMLAVLGCFGWTTWRRAEGGEGRAEGGLLFSGQNSALRPPPSADGWRHVLVGGAFGFLLSLPVGMLGAAPPGIAAVLLGLPLATATILILLGWIRDGQLPRFLPAVGIVVLLVNLLAAGGIGLPSVAGTFWLLLALGLTLCGPVGDWSIFRREDVLRGQTIGRKHGPVPFPQHKGDSPIFAAVEHFHKATPQAPRKLGQPPVNAAAAWIGLGLAIATAVACYATAYSPVLGCQAQLRLAERDPARAVEHLEAAAAADPLAAEPWRRLAAVEFESWWQQPSERRWRSFAQANWRAVELAPNSAPAWLAAGDWCLKAFSKTDREGQRVFGHAITFSLESYRRAAQLYPNGALYRAKLAEAHRAAGDLAAFRREAQTALELDHVTPHSDKKLPPDLRDRLAQGLGSGP